MNVRAAVRRNGVVLGAIAAGVILIAALGVIGWSKRSGGGVSAVQATATAAASDRAAATALVTEFARAVAEGDADALYAVQTAEYRQGCSRADFQAISDAVKGEEFVGIIDLQFQGDQAGATVGLKAPDGSTSRQLLPLQRDTDKTWKIAPPVVGKCAP